MSDYRRWYVPGATYFFTVVTNARRPILTSDLGRDCLRSAIKQVQKRFPFKVFAIVLLPDHLPHGLDYSRQNDSDYSTRRAGSRNCLPASFWRGGTRALAVGIAEFNAANEQSGSGDSGSIRVVTKMISSDSLITCTGIRGIMALSHV